MVAAHEAGVADRIACESVRVNSMDPHLPLMDINPLGKIPTLVLDDGEIIYDSVVICAYFDILNPKAGLIPTDPARRILALKREALGDGLMETLLNWLGERFRQQGEHSDKRIAVNKLKVANSLTLLEKQASDLAATPLDIGHIALGSALAYMDFRFGDLNWRADHPRLTDWHAAFSKRPSVVATAFFDDLAAKKA